MKQSVSGYVILPHTYDQAEKLQVIIKPSKRIGKKIDIFTPDKEYITSIGSTGYLDYPYYLKLYGFDIAEQKRSSYKSRHRENIKKKYSKGWYAWKLLWN